MGRSLAMDRAGVSRGGVATVGCIEWRKVVKGPEHPDRAVRRQSFKRIVNARNVGSIPAPCGENFPSNIQNITRILSVSSCPLPNINVSDSSACVAFSCRCCLKMQKLSECEFNTHKRYFYFIIFFF